MGEENTPQSPFGEEYADLVDTLCAQFGLTRKRLFFAEHYVRILNGNKAARLAGFATPSVEGSRLLTDDNVKNYVSHRFRQLQMQSDEVLGRLSDIARGDIGDYLRVAKQKETDLPLVIDGKIIDGIYIDLRQLLADGNTARIKKYSRVRGEVSIELHDPTKALELIGKHLRLFTDVVRVEDNTRTAAELTDDELAAIASAQNGPQAAPAAPHGAGEAQGVSTPAQAASGPLAAAHDAIAAALQVDPIFGEMTALRQMIDAITARIDAGTATVTDSLARETYRARYDTLAFEAGRRALQNDNTAE